MKKKINVYIFSSDAVNWVSQSCWRSSAEGLLRSIFIQPYCTRNVLLSLCTDMYDNRKMIVDTIRFSAIPGQGKMQKSLLFSFFFILFLLPGIPVYGICATRLHIRSHTRHTGVSLRPKVQGVWFCSSYGCSFINTVCQPSLLSICVELSCTLSLCGQGYAYFFLGLVQQPPLNQVSHLLLSSTS